MCFWVSANMQNMIISLSSNRIPPSLTSAGLGASRPISMPLRVYVHSRAREQRNFQRSSASLLTLCIHTDVFLGPRVAGLQGPSSTRSVRTLTPFVFETKVLGLQVAFRFLKATELPHETSPSKYACCLNSLNSIPQSSYLKAGAYLLFCLSIPVSPVRLPWVFIHTITLFCLWCLVYGPRANTTREAIFVCIDPVSLRAISFSLLWYISPQTIKIHSIPLYSSTYTMWDSVTTKYYT